MSFTSDILYGDNVRSPREEVVEAIRKRDAKWLLDKSVEFHGHYCHKVAYGIKASLLALEELGMSAADDDIMGSVVTLVETAGPFCNGVQLVLGTLGGANLVVRDCGKLAITLLRSDGTAIRVSVRPEFLDGFVERHPEMKRVFRGKYATILVEGERTPLTKLRLLEVLTGCMNPEEREALVEEMTKRHKEAVLKELEASDEEMFKVERKKLEFSAFAPVCECTMPIVVCEACGDAVLETHVRLRNGRKLCLDCAGEKTPMLVAGRLLF
ncbi:MAG: hypothetical protein DRN91_07230 [Candidatus Alkanophagales archaeon]|nr:MAG: hypothetical protein DRN91_07230 [Candidatus Alkanophagales archaeon]